MNSSFYKAEADKLLSINNRKSDFVKITFVTIVLSIGLSIITNTVTHLLAFPLSFLTGLMITPMFSFLLQRTAYRVYCKKDIDIGDLFKDYSRYSDVVLYNLFTTILTILGALLFIIPGIMICYSFVLGNFIMVDEPDIAFNDAMKKSKKMMNGHRWELFKLDLSFIGWLFLALLTLGILAAWIQPRLETSRMVFYARLKKELYGEELNGITEGDTPVENNSIPVDLANTFENACAPVEAELQVEYQAPACESVSCETVEADTETESEAETEENADK